MDETTRPKAIIESAMLEIAGEMQGDGFRYLKSRTAMIKKTDDFVFCIEAQKDSWNRAGGPVGCWIHCSVYDGADAVCFWRKTLARSNSKQDQFEKWEFYDFSKYCASLKVIQEIVHARLLPFFRRFENDLQALVLDVAENGFVVFDGPQVYDAGYDVPVAFLEKYGNKACLNLAFQHYHDRHLRRFVRVNLKNAVALLKAGKEVVNNGEKGYAEYIVAHGIDLRFE